MTKSYEVNLRGPVFLVQQALPHLKASENAAVLNMVSVGAFNFSPMLSIYSSAKAAMMSFTRSMAAEFVGDGIRVNALAPGPVDTDMMRKNPQEAIDHMVGGTLMRRLGTPDEMVGAALLLCSDAGSYITGTVSSLTVAERLAERAHLAACRREDLAAVLDVQRRLEA